MLKCQERRSKEGAELAVGTDESSGPEGRRSSVGMLRRESMRRSSTTKERRQIGLKTMGNQSKSREIMQFPRISSLSGAETLGFRALGSAGQRAACQDGWIALESA